MTNSLRKVTGEDLSVLKECLNSFANWYIQECEKVQEFALFFEEYESDVIIGILSEGLREYQVRMDILKDMHVKRGNEI